MREDASAMFINDNNMAQNYLLVACLGIILLQCQKHGEL